jgi:hypothetical protein
VPNIVQITIKADDATAAGFAAAMARIAALKKAASGVGFNFDAPNLASQLMQVKQKMQAVGLADLLDYNLNQGQIGQQLLMLKRKISQAGISDMLDVNLNPAQIQEQLERLSNDKIDVPVGWDLSRFPVLGEEMNVPIKFQLGALPELPKLGETFDFANINEATAAFRNLGIQADDLQRAFNGVDFLAKNLDAAFAFERSQLDSLGMGFSKAAADAVQMSESNTLANLAAEVARDRYDAQARAIDDAQASASRLNLAIRDTSKWTWLLNGAVAAGTPMWVSSGNLWGGLGGKLKLFGGDLAGILPAFMGTVSGLHMLVDGVVEVVATLVPATIAMAAFGVASIDTVMEITSHIKDLDMANDELGGTIYPLTGGFTKLAAAVKPEVYTLFGEGLVIAAKNAGVFTILAKQAGSVLDQLGARFTLAMTTGDGFTGFLKNGASDLSGWGNLLGNLGGILGNFVKAMPGYAEILLGLANGFTHAVEEFTGSGFGEWLINIGIAAHGAVLYVGLAATLGSILVTGAFSMIGRVALAGAVGLDSMGAAGEFAATGLFATSAAATTLSELPWGWILAAAAGLGILVYELGKSADAASGFDKAMMSAVQSSTIANLGTALSVSISQTSDKIVSSESAVTRAMKDQQPAIQGVASRYATSYNPALDRAATTTLGYQQGLQSLTSTQTLVQSRVAELSKQFGSNKNAMDLLNAAGITTAQITSHNAQTWAEARVEVTAQGDAIRALTGDTGRYAAALNALSGPEQFMGDMLHSIQSIAQAQTNLITEVTQGETSFDTFGQGIATLAVNFKTATKGAQTTTDTVGKLSSKVSLAGAAMGGLTQADMALNQAFYTQVGNAQDLINSLEEQEISTGNLTTATATLTKQMLPFAGNNEAARVTLVAMINDALGPGTVSLKNLNTWVKNNSTSMQGLNNIVATSTIKAGQLANVLQSMLTVQFHQALLQTSGADTALKTYTSDITNNATQTSKGESDRQQLIVDLKNAGLSASKAKQFVDGMQKSIDDMHGRTVGVGVIGGWSVQREANADATAHLINEFEHGMSGGGRVSGWGGGDKWPALLEGGEAVIDKHKTQRFAPLLAAMGVPGFSDGGLVGNLSSMINLDRNTGIGYANQAMNQSVSHAIAAAEAAAKAAQAAATGGGHAGPGGGSSLANAMLAYHLYKNQMGPGVWAAWNNVAMAESGWSNIAQNPTSSAYGIAQALPPSKYPPAGRPPYLGGWSNPMAQITWMWDYMASVYDGPVGAWQHEQAFHWYGNGLDAIVNSPTLIGVGERGSEHVSVTPVGQGGGSKLILEIRGGSSSFDRFMMDWIRDNVRVVGGGDVQVAFGVSS